MFRIFTRVEPGLQVAEMPTVSECLIEMALCMDNERIVDEILNEGFIIYNMDKPYPGSVVGVYHPVIPKPPMG